MKNEQQNNQGQGNRTRRMMVANNSKQALPGLNLPCKKAISP